MKKQTEFNYSPKWDFIPDGVEAFTKRSNEQALAIMGKSLVKCQSEYMNGHRVALTPNFTLPKSHRIFYSAPGIRYYTRLVYERSIKLPYNLRLTTKQRSKGCKSIAKSIYQLVHQTIAYNIMEGAKPTPQLAHVIRETLFHPNEPKR